MKKEMKRVKKNEKRAERCGREQQVKINFKSIIWGLGAILLLVVVIVLIIFLNQPEKISDDYFVTDDTKIVMSFGEESMLIEDNEYEPGTTRWVYLHDGEKITDMKLYYEYENEAEAREAFDKVRNDFSTSKKLNGKYIVFDVKEETYEGATIENITKQAEDMQAAGLLLEV
ncbi:MAG: hypothetical protein Q4B29_02785 [Candidatus Saccharibacteria bacterium]|nr:hypothetical protein [Candidatus Saccharibacteria bacterium]